ncbi:hypothetical protein GWK48_00260 [Metallosphaera tengchongensis]|uniref:Uncharacterized protein n=1 Tax=Metallosphaera tengchongensis TaxID=1532350 RepID=A0A6N0NT03_9CREN|nr:hypothetical protein [Metallosphaera tengchongensis]QKQ99032.1 hypothetical protein GWK48_00260 [Metallosphaera tengchongensis]
MNLDEIFSCAFVKTTKAGDILVIVDGIKVIFSVNVKFSIVSDIELKSTNYKLVCNISFDTRYGKVISTTCTGFKADKVRDYLQECFRERGVLYSPR